MQIWFKFGTFIGSVGVDIAPAGPPEDLLTFKLERAGKYRAPVANLALSDHFTDFSLSLMAAAIFSHCSLQIDRRPGQLQLIASGNVLDPH